MEQRTITVATAVSKTDIAVPPNVEMMFGDVTEDGGAFVFTATGLEVIGEPSHDLWERVGQWLSGTANKIQFWIGDWVNYGEGHFADRVQQAVDATEWEGETVLQAARVAAAIPPENRDPDLSYTHHRAVYAKPVTEQREWLDKAKQEGWSGDRLRAEVQQTEPAAKPLWIVVSCKDAADRDALIDKLKSEGREIKLP